MADYSTAITDRSENDLRRFRELDAKRFVDMTMAERAEWLAGLKATYNASDLNRVGGGVTGAIQTASSQFKEGLTWANTVKGAESAIEMFMGAAGAQNTQFATWAGVAATIGGIVGALKG